MRENEALIVIRRQSDGDPCEWELRHFDIVDASIRLGGCFKNSKAWLINLLRKSFFGDFWTRYHDGDLASKSTFAQAVGNIEKFHGRSSWSACASDVFDYYFNPPGYLDTAVRIQPATSVSDLVVQFQKNLRLPDTPERNLDTLRDCLRSVLETDVENVIVYHLELPELPEVELGSYLNVLAQCSQYLGNSKMGRRITFAFSARAEHHIRKLMMLHHE